MPQLQKTVFIVDYAYGFHANTCDVDYVCDLRCKAAMRALKKYPSAYIVLGASMKEVTGDCGPLADMMQEFLISHHVPPERILKNPQGYNTLTESESAYKLIQKYGYSKIICATSKYHSMRVRLIWIFRFGIFPTMYTTKLKPSLSERLSESWKIPVDALRALAYRIIQ